MVKDAEKGEDIAENEGRLGGESPPERSSPAKSVVLLTLEADFEGENPAFQLVTSVATREKIIPNKSSKSGAELLTVALALPLAEAAAGLAGVDTGIALVVVGVDAAEPLADLVAGFDAGLRRK